MQFRKPNRLKGYDYSQGGAYFVTVCTQNRENLFGRVIAEPSAQPPVGATVPGRLPLPAAVHPPYVLLNKLGKCVDGTIKFMDGKNDIKINKYVIMPNHVHMIVAIRPKAGDRGRSPLREVIRNIKSYVTKQAGFPVWQKSFHDHIIRNIYDHYRIAKYMDENPARWAEDCYYTR